MVAAGQGNWNGGGGGWQRGKMALGTVGQVISVGNGGFGRNMAAGGFFRRAQGPQPPLTCGLRWWLGIGDGLLAMVGWHGVGRDLIEEAVVGFNSGSVIQPKPAHSPSSQCWARWPKSRQGFPGAFRKSQSAGGQQPGRPSSLL